MVEEVAGVDDKAFRPGLLVPKRCQEIRQIKTYGANQPFSLYFGEKTIKIWDKTGLKYREDRRTCEAG